MKVLFLALKDLTKADAQRTHIIELVTNLRNLGFKVDLLAFANKTTYFKFTNLGRLQLSRNILQPLSILKSLYTMFIKAREHQKDTSVVYCRDVLSGVIGVIIKSISKETKLIYEVNGVDWEESFIIGNIFDRMYGILSYILMKLIMPRTDAVIAVTKNIKNEIINEFNLKKENVHVVNNGANTELFKPMKIDLSSMKLDKEYYYIGFVGCLAPWQGVEYIIKSAPFILEEVPNTKFLIVGDGVMKEKLIHLANKTGVSDKFIFTGTVPYKEVPNYVNICDICVAYKRPLKSGYSPLKLYEYMACGKPVTTSNVEGFEILEKQNAGVLIEPNNPKELGKAIIKLLENKELREEMGRNGREYVMKNHSWKKVAESVAEVCKNVVK